MDVRRRSLWLDVKPRRDQAGAPSTHVERQPAWVMGRVTEILDNGWVEVEVPADDPESHATGPTDGLLTYVGALVRVLLDPTGKVLQIASPQSTDTSRTPVATGMAGAMIERARLEALRAASEAGEVRQRADRAKAAADAAARSAATALQAAETNAGSSFSQDEPAAPKDGMIWYQLNGSGQIVGVKVRVSGAWVARPLAAEQVLVPGSVGSVTLADGAVTADKVYASKELWAKMAVFGSVTTDMLVAGNATIPGNIVVGDLYGNSLNGVTVRGSEISLQDTEAGNVQARTIRGSLTGWTPVNNTSLSLAHGNISVSIPTDRNGAWGAEYRIPAGNAPGAGQGANIQISAQCGIPPGMRVIVEPVYRLNGREVDVLTGARTSLSASVPDGAELTAVRVLSIDSVGGFFIQSLSISWVPTTRSGLSISRGASDGVAQIEMRTDNGVARLRPTGAEYIENGASIGGVLWRDLISPPIAFAGWDTGVGSNAGSGAEGLLSVSLARTTHLLGGCRVHQGFIKVPIAGWYLVTASCGFKWATKDRDDWAVAVGIRRSSAKKVDWYNDPAMTLPLIPNVSTRPSAADIMHLSADEGVTLAFWQNTGSWRPNEGTSRLSLHLIDAD